MYLFFTTFMFSVFDRRNAVKNDRENTLITATLIYIHFLNWK